MEFIFTGFNSTGKKSFTYTKYIYIYIYIASSETTVAKDNNPYYPYDQTLVEHDSIATLDLAKN